MSEPKLIGLVGYPGVGKDAAAEFLVKEKGWLRLAFADALRKGILALDPMIFFERSWLRLSAVVEMMGWTNAKAKIPEVRRLLQVYGTEAGREIHGYDCWVDIVSAQIFDEQIKPESEQRSIIVTDVRFPNEVEGLRRHDGTLIRIHRPGVGPVNNHASEQHYDSISCDADIHNDGTPEDLRAKIFAAAGE